MSSERCKCPQHSGVLSAALGLALCTAGLGQGPRMWAERRGCSRELGPGAGAAYSSGVRLGQFGCPGNGGREYRPGKMRDRLPNFQAPPPSSGVRKISGSPSLTQGGGDSSILVPEYPQDLLPPGVLLRPRQNTCPPTSRPAPSLRSPIPAQVCWVAIPLKHRIQKSPGCGGS